uniref:OTU domain-containing protein n=1 Tax=Dunaliella tertiolecta TaxID=3047 RepID=A0A7S3QUC1_DUNTE|mmetsp:Transcript_2567/g.6562  ORF Transcript_2567/g.6562 Transcript_2567/m.6562 type:complete len:304 (+) Transcript_2567:137-1048(+)|eukprot:CAMPEP_0202353924 /NCGR_PEP_ID=MMETSP1126-20121109/9471_1 /ASSEMBLY_ACC=CAM_ASM_000457 /TAXON_ID=3047 /ORGANISM="Dunaliella tertiolecta, Strain CCMP1320" /LENGTH=303 /DNA_ID=CAMNT_0048946331 /DNA_START=135 /DNA_END=1046 /DNA_ORIENTATION=+
MSSNQYLTSYALAFGQPDEARPQHGHSSTLVPSISNDHAIAEALYQSEVEDLRLQQEQQQQQQWRQLSLQTGEQVPLPEELEAGFSSPDYGSDGPPSPNYHHSNSRQELVTQRLASVPSHQLLLAENLQFESTPNARAVVLQRIREYGFLEKEVKADGNCQFRALSDQLYGDPQHHKHVRHRVVGQLRSKQNLYAPFVNNQPSYSAYVSEMSKPGTWGDNVILQAAADYFGLKIYVITSFKDRYVVVIEPAQKKHSRLLYLSFWAEAHYNSLYFFEDKHLMYKSPKKVLGSKKLGRLVHQPQN